MKKISYLRRWLLLSLSSLSLGLAARAADAPMIDSLGTFASSVFPPTEWQNLRQGSSSYMWYRNNVIGVDSAAPGYAYVSPQVTIENDAWLITSQVKPIEGKSTLTFYLRESHYYSYADHYDKDTLDNTVFEVLLSEGRNDLESFTTTLLTVENKEKGGGLTNKWVKQTVDMTAYKDKPVYLAFRVRKNNLIQVQLDSIAGVPLAVFDNDINLKTIFLNPGFTVFEGDARTLCVMAENRGTTAAEVTGSLVVSIDGSEQEPITAQRTIEVGKTDTLKFEYTFAQTGNYELKVSVPQDDNKTNDSITLSNIEVHPANTLVEDFYAGKGQPKNWDIYSNVDNYGTSGWWSTGAGATSSSGYVYWSGVYASSLPLNGGVRALITPQLRIKDGDELSFFARLGSTSTTPADLKVHVLVSATTASIGDFTDTVATYGLSGEKSLTAAWQEYKVDLSKYKDQNIFVSFTMIDKTGAGIAVYLDEVGGNIDLFSAANDARVVMAQMDNPTRYWFAGEKITVRGRVENNGTEAISNLKVSLKAKGAEVGSQTIQALAVGAFSDTLIFEYEIPEAGLFNFEVCVPEDDNNINNASGFSLQTYPAGYFIEGFEEVDYSTFPPQYWSCDRTAYGYGWSVSNFANNTNAYKGNAYVNTYNAGYKLITPLLQITKTDSLCFYIATQAATAEFAVLTSVDAKEWDTLGKASITGGYNAAHIYTLQKFFFNDKDDDFFGNRYVAIMSLQGSLDLDEVFGPMLASRADQFALVNAFVDPTQVAVAGKPFTVKAVVYNDGTQAAVKEVSLYADGEQVGVAQSKNLPAGEYDTLAFEVSIEKATPDMEFVAELPSDASAFDNAFTFNSIIYQSELWRFEDGFEDISHPFWMFTGSSTAWASKPSYNPVEPAAGDNYLQASFYTGENWAISPYLDLRYEKYEVSLDIYREQKSADRPDRIELGFSALPDWENAVFIDSVNRLFTGYPEGAVEGWNHYTFTVALPQMQNGFLILRPVPHLNASGYSSYEFMRFDNLVIRPALDADAELTALSVPADTVWGYDSIKMPLRAVLLNSGSEELTSATIRYGIDGEEIGSLVWTGSLAPDQDTVVEIAAKVAIGYRENFSIYAQVEATGDINSFNDRVEKNVYAKKAYELPFVADFETENWNRDWQNFTYSDDVRQAWFRDTTGSDIKAPFGKACANSASMDDELGAVNPDNWLVTPGLFIKYSKAYLSFYVQAGDVEYFAEKFQVLVSTRSNMDSALFVPVHTQTLENDELQHIVLELNGYRNEVIYVAFRHFDCTDQYRLLLDSVYVYDPQGYTVTATVNPAEAGTVQGAGSFIAGEEVSLTAVANTGYYFTGWYKDAELLTDQNPYSFTCESNVSIEARFAEKTFAITLSAGEGGSVSPSGTLNVKEGEDLEVSIAANEGYVIDDVKVDGVSVGAVETYTFQAVAANHSLAATFKVETANQGMEACVLSVQPNPFVSELCVKSTMPVKTIRMVDLQGKVVLQRNVGGATSFSFNLNLPNGMYIVSVETVDGQHLLQRVVKSSN
ncbi:MAG: choice-of-anchor J domain-containing protein [Lentimicrobiaceae bacterium]|nr:choice-of-anchor J domain-containing protein [Lentimicrobiaceae bacterium]